MTVSGIELFNILRGKLGDNEAKFLTEYIEQKIELSFVKEKEFLATKKDLAEAKNELIKSIYIVGLIQFLAITGSVVGILSFMLKK